MPTHAYADSPVGQIHYTIWGESSIKPTLLCLPSSPKSAVGYYTLAPLLCDKYQVVAIDYPGFGNSPLIDDAPTITTFAQAAISVAATLDQANGIDVLGFHTGCLVAIEASILSPVHFQNLILIDVPFFSQEKLAELKSTQPGKVTLTDHISCIEAVWNACIANRVGTMGLERAFELFIDQIRLGEHGGIAYQATFNYDSFEQAKKVKTPTHVIATNAGLYEESIAAHRSISNARLIEVPNIHVSVLDGCATEVAMTILNEI